MTALGVINRALQNADLFFGDRFKINVSSLPVKAMCSSLLLLACGGGGFGGNNGDSHNNSPSLEAGAG